MSVNIRLFILGCLAAIVSFSCSNIYQESYEALAVDSEDVRAHADTARISVMVYYNGDWTLSKPDHIRWASLDKVSGSGVDVFHINFARNVGLSRKFDLKISADDGSSKTISVTQKAGVSETSIGFDEEVVRIPSGAYPVTVKMRTRLGADFVLDSLPRVSYDLGKNWVSDLSVEIVEDEFEKMGDDTLYTYNVAFRTSVNDSGADRGATLSFSFIDSSMKESYGHFRLIQSADEPYIKDAEEQVRQNYIGGEGFYELESSLSRWEDDFTFEVQYTDADGNPVEDAEEFVENLSVTDGRLTWNVVANDAVVNRYATIIVAHTDLSGKIVSGKVNILQKFMVSPREVGFDELRSVATASGEVYVEPDEQYSNYIVARVVGDAGNPNMGHNINTAYNKISTDVNDRTNYIQDEEGSMGFRLQYSAASDNVLRRNQLLRISLDGVRVMKESGPDRYTIVDLPAANVQLVEEDDPAELVPKRKKIGELVPDDIFTYTILTDVEFSVKKGAYTNIREHDCAANWAFLTSAGALASAGNSATSKDGAANILYDIDGNAIYMLVNVNCEWRRNGLVPQGTGDLGGIIVHQNLPRYGGNVGTYSIRPVDEDDICLSTVGNSQWKSLAEWVLPGHTRNMTDLQNEGYLIWQGEQTYQKGGDSDTVLKQHKLVQTDHLPSATYQSTDVAVIYSENLRADKNTTTAKTTRARNFPFKIAWSYRQPYLPDYFTAYDTTSDPDVSAPYGMSAGSSMMFEGLFCGWHNWKSDNSWDGTTNGIVMEIPTQGVSSSGGLVNFSIAAGYIGDGESASDWQPCTSFPVYWTVEYAVSTDGTSFGAYRQLVDAATGVTGFEMRNVPLNIKNTGAYYSFVDSSNTEKAMTGHDWSMGFVPHSFRLPSDAFSGSKVKIRITPNYYIGEKCLIAATLSSDFTSSLVSEGLKITQNSSDVKRWLYPAIYIEDVRILYK